jgi:hypothetical protein
MESPNVSDVGTEGASGATPEGSSQQVSYETFSKLLGQKKSVEAKLKAQDDELAKYRAAEKEKAEAQLRAEKKHDEIIAALKAENEKLAGSLGSVKTEIANSMKRQALEREIGGFAHPEYAKFANLDAIPLLEDGSLDVEALGKEAARLREQHPHLLKPSQPNNLPNGAPPSAVGATPPAPSERDLYYAHMEKIVGVPLK